MLPLITASDDFAFFAQKVPGLYINVGITPLDKNPASPPSKLAAVPRFSAACEQKRDGADSLGRFSSKGTRL
jgi:metal-dependent amidase/aminoacylase/carboxypeptidase family protein